MTRHNVFKRTLAGILAVLTVAVYMPANVGTGGLFGQTAIIASAADTAYISTADELTAALSNSEVSKIVFKNSITYSNTLFIGRNVEIDLNSKTLEMPNRYVEFLSSCTVSFQNGNITGGWGIGFFYTNYSVTLTLTNLNIDVNSSVVSNLGSGSSINLNNVYTNGKDIIFPDSSAAVTVNDGTVDSPIQFTKKNIGEENVTVTASTYTSSVLTPEIKVDGTTLTEKTDYTYTVTDSKNNPVDSVVNAGTYHVTVTAVEDSNYTGSKTVDWTVNKADPTASFFTFTAPENLYYDSNAKTATITVNDGVEGMGEISNVLYAKVGETGSDTANPTNPGTYQAYIFVDEGDNYTSGTSLTDESWRFTIEQAQATLKLVGLEDSVIEGAEFDSNKEAYILNGGQTYTLYTNKSVSDADEDGSVASFAGKNQTYNGKKYGYKYTLTIPAVPDENGYILSHEHATEAHCNEASDGVYVECTGETNSKTDVAWFVTAETYYYGSVPTAKDITTKNALGAEVGVDKFYFSEEGSTTSLNSDDLKFGKDYIINARIAVKLPSKTTPDYFSIQRKVKFAQRPMSENKYYLVQDGNEIELSVENGKIQIPAGTFTYNGKDQIPEIIVKNGGNKEDVLISTDEAKKDYTSSQLTTEGAYTNAAGYSYKLTAEEGENANYTGEVTVEWQVEKAKAEVTVKPKDGIVYDGEKLNISDFDIAAADENDLLAKQFIDEMTGTDVKTIATVEGKAAVAFDGTFTGNTITADDSYKIICQLDDIENGETKTYSLPEGYTFALANKNEHSDKSDYYDVDTLKVEKSAEGIVMLHLYLNGNRREYWYILNSWYHATQVSIVFDKENNKAVICGYDEEHYAADLANVKGYDITSAGEQKAKITLTNPNFDVVVKEVDVNIAKREVNITPDAGQNIIYGTEKKPVIRVTTEQASDEDGNGELDTKTGVVPVDIGVVDFSSAVAIKDFDYTYFINNAGEYNYEVSDVEFDNYKVVFDSTAVFTVKPKELTEDMFTVTQNGDYIFDGNQKKFPEYTFTDGTFGNEQETAKLTEEDFDRGGTDYAVFPGTYTLEFSGQNNYTGFVSFDWKIKSDKTYSIDVSLDSAFSDERIKTYDGKAVAPTSFIYKTNDLDKVPVKIAGAKTTYTYYEYDGSSDITEEYINSLTPLENAPKDAGKYIVETVATARGYEFDKVYTPFTISPKEIVITPGATGKTYGEPDPDFTDFSYDESAVIEGDTVEITGEYALDGYEGDTCKRPAGEYDFVLGIVKVDNDNYSLKIDDTNKYVVEPQELTDESIAVYKRCTISQDGWAHPDDCIQVFGIVDGKEVELERPVYDKETEKYIGTDFEFISATKTKKTGNFSVQIKGIGNYKGFAEAVIEVKQAVNHVTVKNGKFADQSTSAYFEDNAIVAVTADKAADGYKFGYWKKNGKTISYNPTYTFSVTSDNIELEAVYVEDIDDITRYGNATIENVTPDKENKKIQFISTLNVPEDCTILKAGIVATSDEEKAANLTDENADYVRYDKNLTVHNYKYTWTKTKVNETWYVKGYLVYEDSNGEVKTVYSDMAKATLDGYEMIKEEKILGTAIIDSVTPNVEEKKLQFVAMLSVPADCTINRAGIVATSDEEDAKNLTSDNAKYCRFGENLTVHNYKYTWTKTKVDETWYVRPYLVYTDANGKEYTVYGDLTTGELN